MTGRQACHRVFALSRKDQDRERVLVLPPSPLAVTTVVGILDLRKVSISPEPKSFFCSACALMVWNQPRILFLLEILKWAPALPWLQ